MFNNVTTGYDMSDATWEIVIMLLIAFLLGFLLRHLFCCSKTKVHNEQEPDNQQGSQFDSVADVKARSTRVSLALSAAGIPEPVAGPAIVSATSVVEKIIPTEPESLQRVEGIGPKIEGLLWAGGIITMRQLATADLDTLQKILDAAGPRYRMHNPRSWSPQAELIADENWDELKKYQDFLVAGRES
jgi:predicted flap endonuclease-1-like 5' DNA nuclease